MVPVRVYFGSENYLDKVTISPAEFYARFAVTRREPQDLPAAAGRLHAGLPLRLDARRRDRVDPSFRRVLGNVPGGDRGRRGGIEKTRFVHVDSRNVSVGLGLIVRAAAEAAAAGKDAEEVARVARDAADRTRSFVAVPTLEHLVRGGRVSPLKGLFARILGLLPVLTISPRGQGLRRRQGAAGSPGRAQKMMSLLFAAAEAGTGGLRAASASRTATRRSSPRASRARSASAIPSRTS